MMSYKNKVVLVTGAGQGIGFEIANQYAQVGAKVALNDIEESLSSTAADKINKAYPNRCIGLTGDMGKPQDIQTVFDRVTEKWGGLDIVIANAGITFFADFLSYSAQKLERILKLNIIGTFLTAQTAAKYMVESGNGGKIVLMSSVAGNRAHKGLSGYAMTKAALQMLAKSLVVELAPYRITVNAIAPGATLTERTQQEPTYEQQWSKLTPLGKPASTLDIANLVLFLTSDKANHINGQTIIIDGGWSVTSPEPST